MEDEVFAPIIPVLRVRDVDAAVAYIAKRSVGGAKPLSVYAFAEVWCGVLATDGGTRTVCGAIGLLVSRVDR